MDTSQGLVDKFTISLPSELTREVDAEAERQRVITGSNKAHRSIAIRVLILEALAARASKAAGGAGRPRKKNRG